MRDEIIENFANKKHIPFCERDWERLKQWKWDNGITDDQAQMLTSQVNDDHWFEVNLKLSLFNLWEKFILIIIAKIISRVRMRFDRLRIAIKRSFLNFSTVHMIQPSLISSILKPSAPETASMHSWMRYLVKMHIQKSKPSPRKQHKHYSRFVSIDSMLINREDFTLSLVIINEIWLLTAI